LLVIGCAGWNLGHYQARLVERIVVEV
jgi:hypothetical protein